MTKENIKSYSMEEILKMKDRTREDAPEVPSLPKDFWNTAKVMYPEAEGSGQSPL